MDFKSFQVMTFNTLAQSLVDHKYMENDQTTMSWTKRRHEIYKVIQESSCDIVCLQEIDELDYINFFKEKVEELGYESVYKRKLQNRLDGVLTLYRRDRYELVLKRELNFSSEQEEYDKPQVALIVVLKDLYTTENKAPRATNDGIAGAGAVNGGVDDILIVANTHLIFNKSRGDIKLYQLCSLLAGLKQTYDEVMYNGSNSGTSGAEAGAGAAMGTGSGTGGSMLLPNVLLCGDLNITPQSLMYNFLFHGFAPLKHTNPRCISGQYLMFDKTYLTSSSGHNESGETMGSVRHYVNSNTGSINTVSSNTTLNTGSINTVSGDTTLNTGNTDSGSSNSNTGSINTVSSNTTLNTGNTDSGSSNSTSANKVDEVNEGDDGSFTGVIGPSDSDGAANISTDLGDAVVGGTNANSDNTAVTRSSTGNTSSFDGGDEVIYCPLKLSSAYSVDDGFNCEPAFTAFHGWQKGCVDYICYNPDYTLLEGIYEMPLYTQVRQNGDLPHKKWPASDHFSLISQFKRIK
ncbi:uncharacterized protein TOT_010001261 [Theileria orientalis strain Shintoku]|uniref:Endonuclease/exonuclease/phosphatase domain-containing protein n=1 Tax=Theileria orientalis strain Shintoku TaxID=869250 RepID=J4DNH5_THEOR|nr:uncharacterized protein TOT_010001261 [Theileria orientalis strain Shintoku]BAM38969.1 uncharacterized protein TOT_010001261 [Theileria orientalis strain Shintoku]|eukprot:XP_009689270.1 uncharacterized protein TOT_010001261 [Theileria orientalis strain Shintoku]